MSDSENEIIRDMLECATKVDKLKAEKVEAKDKRGDVKLDETTLSMKCKNKPTTHNDVNEIPMQNVIFGDKKGLFKNMEAAVGKLKKEGESDDGEGKESRKRKPAWEDEADNHITLGDVKKLLPKHLRKDKSYKDYVATRFIRTLPQPSWASLENKKKEGDSEDEALLQTVGFVAKPKINTLPQNHIQIKRLKDLNRATYAEGSITSIQFIPNSTATLVAGTTGVATIYSIDGFKNEKLHSVRFEKFPIYCARLKPCGTKAIFGSSQPQYYIYDLLSAKEMRYRLPHDITGLPNFKVSPCGRYFASAGHFGNVHLFDATSQELIHTFNQQENAASVCFTADSKNLICSAHSSKIYIFSLIKQRLVHSFIDDGCLNGRAMDLSLNQRLLATGSAEGVVNVYDFQKVQLSPTPKPEKTFLNLRTAITDVKFNQTAEVLAMCSAEIPSAVKLAHFPSATVFCNFPLPGSDIGKIRVAEFSPNGGYLALGSTHKAVKLLRLKHYKYY
ncbi:U3 small nucleolar RNA-associated protein 18 homolog [Eurosta solidaginis]|uniref:U3 small nucleolar RNA-associated protein 18 homolog n=1 Tax=Eurosta solidaginis TaxID=178769 RepID=UPI003530FC7F